MVPLIPHLSNTRRAGDLVFVSGQLPFETPGQIVEGGINRQVKQCLANIDTVLNAEGLSLNHIVKTMVWLTSPEDFPEFNQAYAEAAWVGGNSHGTVMARCMHQLPSVYPHICEIYVVRQTLGYPID